MGRPKRARKSDYFETLPDNVTEKILSLAATGELKDIGNIKKVIILISIFACYYFCFNLVKC